MASTYVNDLRIEEQATGENSGTWGTKVNSAFSQIAEAFSYGTKQLAADANETFTMPDGTSDGTRSLYLKITSAGSLTATRTVTLGPNTVSKIWIIENATTGSQSITIAQGSGGTVTIPTGAVKMVYSDGAGAGAAVVDALTDVYLASVDHAAFGDNKKAVFGAGSDLQIYHDGSNNIVDSSAATLAIKAPQFVVQDDAGTKNIIWVTQPSASTYDVRLSYDGSTKLSTTATGIDVTGTVTADGLTVANTSVVAGDFDGGTAATYIRLQDDTDNFLFGSNNSLGNFLIKNETADALRLSVANTGDISFYEDTGTTAKFFWDASAESLGIGTSSPLGNLSIVGKDTEATNLLTSATQSAVFIEPYSSSSWGTAFGSISGQIQYIQGVDRAGSSARDLSIQPYGGNVGIGTSSPEYVLDVDDSSGNAYIAINRATQSQGEVGLKLGGGASGVDWYLYQKTSADTLHFYKGVDRVTIDANGNVGIGTASPSNPLTVLGSAGTIASFTNGVDADLLIQAQSAVTTLTPTTGTLAFGTSSTERMRIDSSGNVGINTTNVTNLLTIGLDSFATGAADTSGLYTDSTTKFLAALSDGYTWNTRDGTERMRIDSSGNLLVGTTSAFGTTGTTINSAGLVYSSADGDRSGHFDRTGVSDGEIVRFSKAGSTVGSIGVAGGPSLYISANDTGLQIYGAGSTDQIVPCDATGATRNDAIDLGKPTGRFRDLFLSGGMNLARDVSLETEIETYNNTNSGGAKYKISFRQNGTQVGVIEVGTSATNYVTSSDYRLKENVVAMSGATERLKQLAPKRFNFITTPDTTVDGFLAHEVQDIVPEAITGTKDAVDAEGNPEYQGIDQSKLVPLLVATIQELEARIAALEGAN